MATQALMGLPATRGGAAPGGFRNRSEAGKYLAGLLRHLSSRSDVVVLGIPRGGVPVAFEVARILQAPLDVIVVRKLGLPYQEELAMGAIAPGGIRILNADVIENEGIPRQLVERVAATQLVELERRERCYRGDRPPTAVVGRTVILVDDGLATGSTMLAAIAAVRQLGSARVICAVPVASSASLSKIFPEVDEIACAIISDNLMSVGGWYEDFAATADEEVRNLLEKAAGAVGPERADPPRRRQSDPGSIHVHHH